MINGERQFEKPLRWGMIGGGKKSQIGYIHRSAALRDSNFELLAGAFDINPEAGIAFGKKLQVDESRCYPNAEAMFEAEKKRDDGIEVVTIATPNHTHFKFTKLALEYGLHVVCEKPLCFTTAEAKELRDLSIREEKVLAVAYVYSGYQLIDQARQMIALGELGEIRIINMQFAHGFHNVAVEKTNASTRWRTDPKFSGPSYVLGDLATHTLYLSEVMAPDLKIKRLLCSRQSFVESRAPLEDNAYAIMEYDNGALGTLWTSAVNAGSMHSQRIRVVGEKASIEWWDEHPNQLRYEIQGEPVRILDRAMDYLSPEAQQEDRISGGHPEGIFEAFSNLYRRFALAMVLKDQGKKANFWYPDVQAGLEGVRWVENCVRSADQGAVWIEYN